MHVEMHLTKSMNGGRLSNEDANGNEAFNGYIDIDTSEGNELGCCSKQILRCTDPRRWLELLPIITWLPKYSFQDLYGDTVAGITVALTVIPQGLALAGVAQLPPQYGLYTAFMGSFVYIFVGSAKDLTIGPTAIMCIMTSQYTKFGGPTYAVLLALLSGVVQLLLGLLNLGFIIDFISGSVISAFTSAGALTIASTQLKGLTGIPINSEHLIDVLRQLVANSYKIKWNDTILGTICIVVLLALRYFRNRRVNVDTSRLPKFLSKVVNTVWFTVVTARNVIVVLICGGLAAVLDARGRRPFALTDDVKGGLPPLRLPDFTFTYNDTKTNSTTTLTFPEIVADLNMGIVVIALLSILESIAIAKAFSKGKRLNATQEMVALGCCNIAGSFVSAFPATGSFSRSAINNSSGVRTPMGGLFTGLVVLSALAFFSPYFKFIPKATLAAIIITSVIFMIHYEDVGIIWRTSRIDMAPYLFTFFGSFIFGLEYGIMMGVVVAVILLLHHSARPNVTVSTVKTENSSYVSCRIDRTVLFPSALYVTGKIGRKIREEVSRIGQETTLVLVDGSRLSRVDYTTCMAFKNLCDELAKDKSIVAFSGLPRDVREALAAALGDMFKCLSSPKECDDFIAGLGSTQINIPESL
ncbi:sodium-independent sulfate anion transporter [Galendromus occidentalis]|uniref:Sodium-independent sulfate anion transporter n=1 Tax=Galendromus occidentalis TaxID=34638 RepID=A0AAJ6QQB1_9ACAR|nr:sodium-independent sulfate anion transporter [Galendromus occidentalis]